MAEEATINTDGTQEMPPVGEAPVAPPIPEDIPDDAEIPVEEVIGEVSKGIDPALYIIALVVIVIGLAIYFRSRKKDDGDDFFTELDGDKVGLMLGTKLIGRNARSHSNHFFRVCIQFNIKLPEAVDEYYTIKEKCLQTGWKPGQAPPAGAQQQQTGPHRVLAQALMKRCIADIPIVTHIQKESTGMNKLYSQSMCSVKQWRAYQAAEALVSNEVNEVRAEAEEIEPGWSEVSTFGMLLCSTRSIT